jgi:hypothetical protein
MHLRDVSPPAPDALGLDEAEESFSLGITERELWYNDPVRAQDGRIEAPPSDVAEIAGHFVQLYAADKQQLVRNVARYLAAGLRQKQGALVVATAEHRGAFLNELGHLGIDTDAANREGWLTVLDAEQTLDRFMTDGYPDAQRFGASVGTVVHEALARAGHTGLRVFGEMVGLLWQSKEYPAAIRLEQLWNRLRKTAAFDLYCGYPIDLFDRVFQTGLLSALLCSHTHLIPAGSCGDLENAIERAMHEELGPNVLPLEPGTGMTQRPAWPSIPKAEATILWLRTNMPDRADAILARAREHYETSVT